MFRVSSMLINLTELQKKYDAPLKAF